MSESLLKEIRDLLVEIRDSLKSKTGLSSVINTNKSLDESEQEQKSWKQHLEDKKPKNDYEIIALIVERLTSDEKQSVTKEEIKNFIRNNPDKIENPKTLPAVIDDTKNNTSYGYIEFASKKDKTYRLSIKGKQLVRRLPEREPNMRKKSRRKKRTRT